MAESPENPADYEAVNDYVDALLAGKKPRRASRLKGDSARLLRTAAQLSSISSRQGAPTQPFVEALADRLEGQASRGTWRSYLSRRGVLGGIAGALALLVAGGIGDRLVLRPAARTPSNGWVPISKLSELTPGVVKRFQSGAFTGHLMNIGDEIWALSAICTHQACLLSWQAGPQLFECPCHGALFNSDGTQHPIPTYDHVLEPLVRVPARIQDGQVYVQIPESPGTAPSAGDY